MGSVLWKIAESDAVHNEGSFGVNLMSSLANIASRMYKFL